ncbi:MULTISPECIES: class I SAM-dependent methyltransferase [Streptomyces]|uniref:Class I SAM-dependent methyltransferase n=1 Tax=Streptomyces odorifer TaxID=53450 RepID=A0A7Y6C5I4_9ACTN|nr:MULTISPECIES: class I SAM-dependent methyltransferase [Streptomyces albidoflavus group]MCR0989320.1 class I SAM-dependent methyltransferase [Streptomyces albidoflavus]NUV26827.1 class I SAM-dependent methyltransferase [Streptomyces odorifer]NUV36992.1 class I SAM-dependent methyltransferase [Streptomyces sp. KAI-27]NUV46799.1 class I SAM-dependent methyltransferase [Streptomyces sp. CAI-78]
MSHDHTHVREFFTPRAATWDSRFPDDGPAYEAAVRALGLRAGDAVLDAGCGTGRALPALRAAVGAAGAVLGADLTEAMLAEAVRAGRREAGALLLTDAERLPLRTGTLDAVFAAGMISHLADPVAGVREWARVVRPGGTLALFHPVGRAALAARQGRTLTPDDLRAEAPVTALLEAGGWRVRSYADEPDRYLVLAGRTG